MCVRACVCVCVCVYACLCVSVSAPVSVSVSVCVCVCVQVKTPEWAVFGRGMLGDGGFDPAETHHRKGDSRSVRYV